MEELEPVVRTYAWGDRGFIARLRGRTPSGEPEAELWVGTHPGGPSRLAREGRLLAEAVAADPLAQLGTEVARRFGSLPFLTKILAAARPLSIQAHPDAEAARAGYEREERAGVPVDAPDRVYRDQSHKPELVCAITPFEARYGFRSPAESGAWFESLRSASLDGLIRRLGAAGSDADVLADVVRWLLHLPRPSSEELVDGLVEAAAAAHAGGHADAEVRWVGEIAAAHPGDIGVVAASLLNHVTLQPGQALYLGSGVLHCYLRGNAVEAMASSDNVVRCALTEKHVDIDELLRIVDFDTSAPAPLTPDGSRYAYPTPAPEFELTRIELDGAASFEVSGPETVMSVEGSIRVEPLRGDPLEVGPGRPVWIAAADKGYRLEGRATVFRTSVPV